MSQGTRAVHRRGRARLALVAVTLAAALALPSRAWAIALEPVDTYSAPIHVTSPPGDPRLFVVERAGTIKVFKDGATLGTNFLDISSLVGTDGERGLLSMAFDPNYASNGLFYVFFNDNGTGGAANGDIHVDEFTAVPPGADTVNTMSRRRVLTIAHSATNHNGGQLQFGHDGRLYVSVGDNADGSNAQTLTNLLGKLLRIDPHGAADGQYSSAGNPFADGPGGNADEIWASGLRNPFRFSIDHLDGSILIGDVGGTVREEIDYLPPSTGFGRGANLGWPCREGLTVGPNPGACSGTPTFTDPIVDYPHSDCPAYAVIGGFVYRGSDIPGLNGRYLYTDTYCAQLRSIQPLLPLGAGDRPEGIGTGTTVSFGEDRRCELYIADIGTGVVSKIVPFAGAQPGPGGCPTSAGGGPAASAPVAAPTPTPNQKRCRDKKTKRKRRACHKKRKKKHGK